MPIESRHTIISTKEVIPTVPLQRGEHTEIKFRRSKIHVFCDPVDGNGAAAFSGETRDLNQLVGETLLAIEPDQMLGINSTNPLIICDDENVVTLQHTNVFATCFKNLTADQM